MPRTDLFAACWLALVAAWAVGWSQARGEDWNEQVTDEFSAMALRGAAYDPRPLHALGTSGLEGVLNRLFPETAPAAAAPPRMAEGHVKRLLADLGADDYPARERATAALIDAGRTHRKLVAKAADSDDAEVSFRARRILAAWEPRNGRDEVERSLSGFSVYTEGIKDPERLAILARRTMTVAQPGWPEGSQVHLLRLCVAAVARGENDDCCDLLLPLVEHDDLRMAKLATETVGSYKDKHFFPRLMVKALASDREEVVETAIRWCQHSRESAAAGDVRRALQAIFAGRSEPLRFQASMTLAQEFDDPAAWGYLIEQTQSKEPLRAASALARLADASHLGRDLPAGLLETLDPYFRSEILAQRWGAAKALGVYAGEKVVGRLVSLLGDKEQSVVDEVERSLKKQKDQKLVRAALKTAAVSHTHEAIRLRAGALLAKIETAKP